MSKMDLQVNHIKRSGPSKALLWETSMLGRQSPEIQAQSSATGWEFCSMETHPETDSAQHHYQKLPCWGAGPETQRVACQRGLNQKNRPKPAPLYKTSITGTPIPEKQDKPSRTPAHSLAPVVWLSSVNTWGLLHPLAGIIPHLVATIPREVAHTLGHSIIKFFPDIRLLKTKMFEQYCTVLL